MALLRFSVAFLLLVGTQLSAQKTHLFVGTYTDGKPGPGIYIYKFNAHNGKLKPLAQGENIVNSSFITLSPDGKYLYACTETKTPGAGSISAFALDKGKGKLRLLNKYPSEGDNPVYLSVHSSGRWVINANYSGGSASVYAVNADGSLQPAAQRLDFSGSSVIPGRQEAPHIHAAVFSPDEKFAYFTDLGSDRIYVYAFHPDREQPLEEQPDLQVRTIPGSGPRHLVFHPRLPVAYCVEELSGAVSVYNYRQGKLEHQQRLNTYRTQMNVYGGADVHPSPDGKFLYVSNRLGDENTIAVFAVNPASGFLTLLSHTASGGDHPRNFVIDPSGKFLLVGNMLSNDIRVFKRNTKTGTLKPIGKPLAVPQPACLKMPAQTARK